MQALKIGSFRLKINFKTNLLLRSPFDLLKTRIKTLPTHPRPKAGLVFPKYESFMKKRHMLSSKKDKVGPTHQAYHDTRVLCNIFLVRNKSLTSPNACTFPSALRSNIGSPGYSFLFVVAISRNIFSVSVTFPFSNKYLDDSGVNLQET